MKASVLVFLLAVGVAFGLSLVVRAHPPLGSAAPGEEPADNSYCYVCHVNLKEEELAELHRPAGVGCMDCHGWSDDHSADEDNVTPPDTMFPRWSVASSCLRCHGHDADDANEPARRPAVAATAGGRRVVCTDCHGTHRLAVRTRQWDKITGKLIYDDGVRMVSSQPASGFD